MSLAPLHSVNTFVLLGVLAFGPFGGCQHSSTNSTLANPGPTSGPGGGSGGGGAPSGNPGGTNPGPRGGGGGAPRGGTPEPGTMLLLGGSAAGYLAMRRRKQGVEVEPAPAD